MARLICAGLVSLDGYLNDADGKFDWAEPSDEVHQFVNDRERSIGTYLYGRRLYDTMVYWETAPTESGASEVELDYARVWQSTDKIIYSTTLREARSRRTRVESRFDPDAVAALKETSDRDLAIGGAGLAAHAFRAGLVDEVGLFVSPVIVGGGTRYLPDGVRLDLDLREERRFANGVVYTRYDVRH